MIIETYFILFIFVAFLLIVILSYIFAKTDNRYNVTIKYYNIDYESNIGVDDRCAICQEPLNNEETLDKVVKLECRHLYHIECLNKWTLENIKVKRLQNATCPLCKTAYCHV